MAPTWQSPSSRLADVCLAGALRGQISPKKGKSVRDPDRYILCARSRRLAYHLLGPRDRFGQSPNFGFVILRALQTDGPSDFYLGGNRARRLTATAPARDPFR